MPAARSVAYIASDLAEGETLAEFRGRVDPPVVKRRWRVLRAGKVLR